jgi:putative acetyltransferase
MTVSVLPESWEDANAVRAVHLAAFPKAAEADLVQNLHAEFSSEISLVAKDEGHLIGHVMLSRMRVSADARSYRALGLGPIAVVPERQRQGIGRLLIEAALDRAAKSR